jgi:hypothetical protein
VRQAAMAFKCLLLVYYKNSRCHNFRRQVRIGFFAFQNKPVVFKYSFLLQLSENVLNCFKAQMLTLVEYTLLLYRAFLPAPVWYRFFFNKDFGSLFSSLITGLYLTFKLTSSVEKVSFHSLKLAFPTYALY